MSPAANRHTEQGADRPVPPGSDTALPETALGRWLVLAVLLLAFLLRLNIVVATRHSYRPLTDAADFDRIAQSITNGHGFGNAVVPPAVGHSAFRAPVYPTVLSAAYAPFGHSYTAGRIENALIGTIVVVMIGVLASQLWGRRVGAVALAIAAVHPTLMLVGTSLQLEPLLVALSLASLAAALQYRRSHRQARWLVVCGVLMGLATLTREIGWALLLPVAWLVWTADGDGWRDRRSWRLHLLAAPAGAVLLSLAVVAPWTIRNAVVLHAFVPVTTTPGIGLAGTYNQTSYSNKSSPALWIPAYQDPAIAKMILARPHPTEVEADRDYRKAAIDFARHHITYVPKVLYWNTIRLFDLRGTGDATYIARFIPYSRSLTEISVLTSYLVEALAVVALFLGATKRIPKAIWLFPALAFLTVIVLSGNIRYRASLEPFSVLLASFTVARVVERLGLLTVVRSTRAASGTA
jgi:4-amino-4-deoxy-L-arabinose transferase-like glycosyltransferase